ncbi:hypothetical protein DFH27DRAFT_532939 [Peziza echinospora]|nr:hypothetical protein DFH27DRAFT_532939 [Peziza echinospora]
MHVWTEICINSTAGACVCICVCGPMNFMYNARPTICGECEERGMIVLKRPTGPVKCLSACFLSCPSWCIWRLLLSLVYFSSLTSVFFYICGKELMICDRVSPMEEGGCVSSLSVLMPASEKRGLHTISDCDAGGSCVVGVWVNNFDVDQYEQITTYKKLTSIFFFCLLC